jgi:hypothetical protein
MWKSRPTVEGAGVNLKRGFSNSEVPLFDPFLLFDDFHSSDPSDYIRGFPWHPHLGIETITYMLKGEVEHGDSMGNSGTIYPGDVQWMTAGSGIVHQEMPKGDTQGAMAGFQLWANLPAAEKMTAPRYREVKRDEIPVIDYGNDSKITLICGSVGEHSGPVKGVVTDPLYIDVAVGPEGVFEFPVEDGYTAFLYMIEGSVVMPADIGAETIVLFESQGDSIALRAGKRGARFLLCSGKPLGEPVAWGGPIVMNTREELRTAFEEYQNGTFIKAH